MARQVYPCDLTLYKKCEEVLDSQKKSVCEYHTFLQARATLNADSTVYKHSSSTSTVQYSTVQCSTVQYSTCLLYVNSRFRSQSVCSSMLLSQLSAQHSHLEKE
jgi:hypothetical protein